MVYIVIAVLVLVIVVMLSARSSKGGGPTAQAPLAAGPEAMRSLPAARVAAPVQAVTLPAEPSIFGASAPAGSPFDHSMPAQADDLRKLDDLRQSGVLTDDQYLQAKARLQGGAAINTDLCSVTVTSAGPNKIAAIKSLRECRQGLDLLHAKNLVDALPAPQVLFQGLSRADAAAVVQHLTAAGVSAFVS